MAGRDRKLITKPISGGLGMALLEKMGWKPGEGLGKNSEGILEPIELTVKVGKKGLSCDEDKPKKNIVRQVGDDLSKLGLSTNDDNREKSTNNTDFADRIDTINGKYPITILKQYCKANYIAPPVYKDHSNGPFDGYYSTVTVNGIEYSPNEEVLYKKKRHAQNGAAYFCLISLGVLPR